MHSVNEEFVNPERFWYAGVQQQTVWSSKRSDLTIESIWDYMKWQKMKFGNVLKTIEEIPAELPKNCLRAAAGSKRQAKSGHTSDLWFIEFNW